MTENSRDQRVQNDGAERVIDRIESKSLTEEGRSIGVRAYLTLALSVQDEVESRFRLSIFVFFGTARRLEEVGRRTIP